MLPSYSEMNLFEKSPHTPHFYPVILPAGPGLSKKSMLSLAQTLPPGFSGCCHQHFLTYPGRSGSIHILHQFGHRITFHLAENPYDILILQTG